MKTSDYNKGWKRGWNSAVIWGILAAIAAFILGFLTSCVNPSDNLITIKAGHHRAILATVPHADNEIYFTFTVNESWLQRAENSQINKVCGFSLGAVHENSARLGWQYDGDKIIAYAYTYVEGVRFDTAFSTLEVGKEYTCQISKENDIYHFRLNEVECKVPAAGWLPGDVLLPYIGGDDTFTRDWWVIIKISGLEGI